MSEPNDSEQPQFDTAEFADAAPGDGTNCTSCEQAISGEYYEANGAVVCAACRDQLLAALKGGSKPVRFAKATVFGLLAGTVGAGIY